MMAIKKTSKHQSYHLHYVFFSFPSALKFEPTFDLSTSKTKKHTQYSLKQQFLNSDDYIKVDMKRKKTICRKKTIPL